MNAPLDRLALASLVLCLVSLAAFVVAARAVQPPLVEPGQLADYAEGARVVLSGAIRSAKVTTASISLVLCRSACARVVAFRDARNALAGRIDFSALRAGAVVAVEGIVRHASRGEELHALAGGAFDVLQPPRK